MTITKGIFLCELTLSCCTLASPNIWKCLPPCPPPPGFCAQNLKYLKNGYIFITSSPTISDLVNHLKCSISDQCRSIPINAGSNLWHWSKMYWLAWVSMPQILSGIDHHWSALIIDPVCPEIVLCSSKQEFRDEVVRSWQKENLDAVICPPFACTAMPLGSSSDLVCKLISIMLMSICNVSSSLTRD